jgi:hypothetical protein
MLELYYQTLDKVFRELWGDNGDRMSMLYAGTRFVYIHNAVIL